MEFLKIFNKKFLGIKLEPLKTHLIGRGKISLEIGTI